ncbi:MAG: hypothetical protein ACK526_03160 [Planctomyces sp.]
MRSPRLSLSLRFLAVGLGLLLLPETVSTASEFRALSVSTGGVAEFRVPGEVLIEELQRRTGIQGVLSEDAEPKPSSDGSEGLFVFKKVPAGSDVGPEGFQISTSEGNSVRMEIRSEGRRGALFGAGFLLRRIEAADGKLILKAPINSTQRPRYQIRGHQLGYRAQANSYDAWDEKIFDQYIRELTFFGTNCVENIPFQDERPTPIMPVGRLEMNRIMSSICDKYDVDYWVWTPADFDLTDKAKRAEALKFHEAFYQECPRLDAIFFPGGDPGDNHPREVMPFLEDLSKILPKYHPKARIWMSLQGFEGEKTDYFFEWLNEHQPDWLGGLVAGPGSPPLPDLRRRLNAKYALRDYPDITHVVRCQHPEQNLDPVFSLTAGREPINPRPLFYSSVFAETAPHANGFLSYSDGCQDDVNKILWSSLGWNPEQTPRDILVEYARCYFPGVDSEKAADGILGLEQNWQGSLSTNSDVETTLSLWQSLDASHPEFSSNWRWQMLLVRACYDAYQKERLIHEARLEQDANTALQNADSGLPADAMRSAEEILSRAESQPVRSDLRNRIVDLFAQLYQTIRFQSSVEKYHAIHPQRGCMLDFLDYPLNNRFWLEDEFHKVRTLPTLEARRDRLRVIRTWENPGEGSFYDDIGHPGKSPRAVRRAGQKGSSSYWWYDNGMSRLRLSWLVTGNPESLEYTELDPSSDYILRFSGFGDLKPRGDGETLSPALYETAANTLKEYPVPRSMTQDGKLKVTFDSVHLEGVNWRHQPRLAEAWLIRRSE